MTNPEALLADDMASFYDDPLGFVMYSFPWNTNPSIQLVELAPDYQAKYGSKYGPDEWACKWLEELGEEVRKRGFNGRDAVDPIQFTTASGHGIGKSTLTAWLIMWIMSTRPNCQGTVTANTAEQLRTKTWAELGKWHKMSVTRHWFIYNSGRGNMSIYQTENKEEWKCSAQTSREENSESFAGQHAASSTSFYIFDEASAIPDKIFDVREGGTTDGEPMTFDFGNPTRNTGRFFENCMGQFRHRYIVHAIDSRDVNITNKARLSQWVADYGEDSDFVKVRIKGVFPSIGIVQFIPTDSVLEAMEREAYDDRSSSLVFGVDVARFGDDDSVIYPRMGRDASSWKPIILKGADTVQVAGAVIDEVKKFRELGKTVRAIFVDCGGVGGGVFDQLHHLGYAPTEVHAQHRPIDRAGYRFRTDEMWGRMKDAVIGGLCLPKRGSAVGKELFVELTQREYGYTIQGQVNLESKKDMKERGVQSPNIADALALTYYADVSADMEVETAFEHKQAQGDYDPLQPNF